MRESLQDFMKKIKGKTVFIIGGGPSVEKINFNDLSNEVVICINDSYEDFPNATAIYWVDSSWGAENYDELKKHSCENLFTSVRGHHMSYDKNNDPRSILNSVVLKRMGDFGYSPEPDCIMGNNSGVQVLNFIINMKAKKIVLIGFDMKKNGNKTHYHDKPRLPINDDIYNNLFIPSMNSLAKDLKKYNNTAEIINANPDSGIRCFKFDDYKNHLTRK